MRREFLFILVLSALGLAQPPQGHAADAVLTSARGEVLTRSRGEKKFKAAAAGAELSFGDELKTRGNSLAHVVFGNGDVVLVKENSNFTLQGDKKKVLIYFALGEFLIGLKRELAPGESFQVRTPAALAAVRGTLFWGLSKANKDSGYASFGHSISITSKGKTVRLNAGEKITIPFGKAPGIPAPSGIPLTYLDTFALDDSLQGLKDLVDLSR